MSLPRERNREPCSLSVRYQQRIRSVSSRSGGVPAPSEASDERAKRVSGYSSNLAQKIAIQPGLPTQTGEPPEPNPGFALPIVTY